MRGRRTWFMLTAMAAVLGLALIMGCATGGTSTSAASSQADLLNQAGFKLYTANNNHNVSYIHTLPAKKVVSNQYKGKLLYLVCTQPNSKQCFLGDKAAYERYQQMAIQSQISEDQRTVSEERWDPEALQMWVDSQGGG